MQNTLEPTEQSTSRKTALAWLWLTLAVIVLDYLTKILVINSIDFGQQIEILPFFNLVHVRNEGAAFSFLATAGGWQRWMFAIISFVVSLALFFWLKSTPRKDYWLGSALALILGGALGNLYDRLVYGSVVDFLDFHGSIFNSILGYSHFPAFNVADMAISVGAFMMIVDVIRNPHK